MTNPIAFLPNSINCFPSLPLVPEFKADYPSGGWWTWLNPLNLLVAGLSYIGLSIASILE